LPGAFGKVDTAHADRITPCKDPHVRHLEADGLTSSRGQQYVVAFHAGLDADNAVALVELHGNLAVLATSTKSDSLLRRTVPRVVANITSSSPQVILILRQGHDGGDALTLFKRQQVDQRLATRLRGGQAAGARPSSCSHAARGEEQDRRVRVGHKQPGDEILVLCCHARPALAAAALRPVGRQAAPA
jgi:hypothetical protein